MTLLLLAGLAAATAGPGPAAADDCSAVGAWINEVDYDSNDGGFNNDRDEFVEIAAPSGTDLGGYHVLAVEGNASFFTCGTGIGGSDGAAYFDAVVPAGTVVGDDTGTGVGFLVVCFVDTSQNVEAAGDCDVVLPGVASDSNLKNGNLAFGGTTNCPDGVLLLDASSQLVDAVSWEGVIPDTGPYGAFFNAPNPSYNAGEDAGYTAQESLQKTSSSAGRALSAGEWAISGGAGTATPGAPNPGQVLVCDDPVQCGDGVVEGAEECDDGNVLSEDGCSASCQVEECGDGVLQAGLGESCDDGNLVSEDGCSATCQAEFCGDGLVQAGLGEECDDSNAVSGDGCSAVCTLEFCGDGVLQVALGEQCDDGNTSPGDGCSATCQNEFCGDGVVNGSEQCDDGNTDPGDGCSGICQLEECGNGVLDPGEACDDGNLVAEDGCSDLCEPEFCGDAVLQTGLGEECDDGNTLPGDGCDEACLVELCGNGVVDPGEYCDDGNTVSGDGCSAACFNEAAAVPTLPGWGVVALAIALLTAGSLWLEGRRARGGAGR